MILGWVYRRSLIDYQHTFDTQLSQLQNLLRSKRSWILIILILASFAYYYFGFVHSYIPYPTAWDANHEYMYTPKVIAESGGILWGNTGPADGMPYIWHGLIAFCFAFWQPLTSVINIAADTFAINMNFLSGILVLLF